MISDVVRRRALPAAGLLIAVAAVLVILVVMRSPSLDRVWDEDVRVLSGVAISESGKVTFSHIRNWTYTLDTVESKNYFEKQYDPRDIRDLWMYEQQLDSRGLIAHTFLVFEFDESYGEGQYLGLSIETRRELGEEYSVVGGALRSFEITHIWATENDLVTRRVQFLDYPLTRYRLAIPQEYLARIFAKFARETAELAHTPEWYNTLTNNCTSSLIKYVNQEEPGAIPRHYSYVFTGRADDYLAELSFLDATSELYLDRAYLSSQLLR